MSYPVKHELDGVFFRVKRDGKWDNVCFSDMTHEEREEKLKDRSVEWWKSLANTMADTLYEIGEQFGIFANYGEI